ncbi:hypothetical protein BCR44DRAFT_1436790 [Catenaria anguillulae PL171]|uniref:Uncharacterized protein n=1 Tax=Catenaria anguillulae PL171 TaxID=765915 RepID=A0A1Y2HHZ2_9FUNG|nr:hypothetical protein BCR44DRAFT_1436790 [Catenaria anguillulae PL171]
MIGQTSLPSASGSAAQAAAPLPETPAPIRAIRNYTSTLRTTTSPLLPRSHSQTHPTAVNSENDNDDQESGSDQDSCDQDDDANDPDQLTMLPMHRKPATPNQPDSTPTSSSSSLPASVIPRAGAGKATGGHLPKHMRSRAQAGYSSPTDKLMSPVSTKLSRSSVPLSKPAVGDLSPLFAKAKISDRKQQSEKQTQAHPASPSPSNEQ